MRRWFQQLHVGVQLALVCLLSALLVAGFSSYYFKRASDTSLGTLREYGQSMMGQLEQTVDTNYNSYTKILRLVSFDKDVQAFLLNADETKRVDLHSALKRALIEVATLSGGITDIIIEDTQGRLYNLADSLLPLPEMDLDKNAQALSPVMHRTMGSTRTEYLVMGMAIYSIDSYNQTNQRIGNVYLALSTSAFTGDVRTDTDASLTLLLTDSAGVMLWGNSASATQAALDEARRDPTRLYYYADTTLKRSGYRIYAMQRQPENLYASSQMSNLATSAALALMLILLWVFWARNLARPLRTLRRFIQRLQGGTMSMLDDRVILSGYQEAEVIGSEFNALLEKTQRLTGELVRANTELYESQLLVKQSELSHLRSQINPHFLYNTLETMVGIAYTNNQPELASIARSLSLIFKYSIKGGAIVPLRMEWKIAQSYIDIQHYRFSERFDVHCTLAPECDDLLVPKLILQPMIENAIVHGIEQQDGFCHLNVMAALDGDTLLLTVSDDGAGIPPDILDELNARLLDGDRASADSTHIGILNVDSRIKLHYGKAYGVALESGLGRGTVVTLRLPARKEAADA